MEIVRYFAINCTFHGIFLLMTGTNFTHLRQLEAESIHILREVAAEFDNPVMLYSIGKDSSVLLHLARKAFDPGKIPFPLMHIDTTYKFREMITFRDDYVRDELGMEMIVHTNAKGRNIEVVHTNANSCSSQSF